MRCHSIPSLEIVSIHCMKRQLKYDRVAIVSQGFWRIREEDKYKINVLELCIFVVKWWCETIDVFATVRANGLETHTLQEKGGGQNHFGWMLVE